MSTHFQLLEPIHPGFARFAFQGPFEGNTIQWQAELQTLEYYYAQGLKEGLFTAGQHLSLQQFIEIPQQQTEPLPILIVHAIPEIKQASILKTIIMLQNYKRLHRGRHAYGDFFDFGAPAASG